VVLLVLAVPLVAETVSGKLTVYVLNVGQGDAILIVCPHGTHRLLIDAGNYSRAGKEAFQALLTRLVGIGDTIQVVVASHPHEDHIGSMHWVLSNFRVMKFIDNGQDYTSRHRQIRALADSLTKRKRLKYYAADRFPASTVAKFCTASNIDAELLIPSGFGTATDPNDNSVVVLVRYNEVKLLFTGDAMEDEESELLSDPGVAHKLKGAAFYKVGHHGSETSSTAGLVAALGLQVAAVSSGCKDIRPNDGYRHPRAVVIDRLQGAMASGPDRATRQAAAGLPARNKWTTVTLKEQLYVTAVDGTIAVVSDGQKVERVPTGVTDPLAPCS